MTIKMIARAIKKAKPAIIRERGVPRFVVLDWKTYTDWAGMQEDLEDSARLAAALADSRNKKRIPFSRVKKLLKLP